IFTTFVLDETIYYPLFFFPDPLPPDPYPLSLHDALPISRHPAGTTRGAQGRAHATRSPASRGEHLLRRHHQPQWLHREGPSRLRSEEHSLNSSHSQISYAVFCLKKKKTPALSTDVRTQ